MNMLRAEGLYKIFGRRAPEALEMLREGHDREAVQQATDTVPAVIDATFEVQPGEIFVVMGLSGSGKSTLVRMLNRMHPPTAGRVLIGDTDVTSLAPPELRALRAEKISMVFQHFGLFPHRTVLENAMWGLEVRKIAEAERRTRAAEALELVGLGGWGDSYPGELSGGMQQRVGLARAIATDADILLMDEAFSALDPLIRSEMQEQLVELQQNLHKTIIFITHDLNEAMFLGDRIAVMKDGRIVQIGTTEEILQDPANDYVEAFVQDVDRSRVLTASAVMEEPIATILRREGPKAALKRMRERQVSALYVVDPGRRLVGATLDDEVIEAIMGGEHRLENITHTDVPVVDPDTPLNELLMPSAQSRLPLAVVKDGKLLGVIPRVTLLAALGGVRRSNGTEVPQVDVPGDDDREEAGA
ncbi:MAG: glycine betaine/L-proline ABC transporter ATP-binding protein [Coriobacteriia bacterium]